jgi:integrase
VTTAAELPRPGGGDGGARRVLATRKLRPGCALDQTASFADDVWSLTPGLLQKHQHNRYLDFGTLPAQFALSAKEVFYALLTGDLPAGFERCRSLYSIHSQFGYARDFLRWADQRGVRQLTALTEADIGEYVVCLKKQKLSAAAYTSKLRACSLFWRMRHCLTADQLRFEPVPRLLPNGRGERRRENVTERIPEQVLAPLLTWALRWVEDLSGDVIAAYCEWRELQKTNRRILAPDDLATRDARLSEVLAGYRRDGRPLPGRSRAGHGRGVNYFHLAMEAGTDPGHLHTVHRKAQILAAADGLGISDRPYLRLQPGGLIGGEPWLGQIGHTDVEALTRHLHTACYIVIAYLSGMRESEVKHLQRGCVARWDASAGVTARYKVCGRAFKGEQDPDGADAAWVVSASAARAVSVVEQLQDPDENDLFSLLPASRHRRREHSNLAKTTNTTNYDLARFQEWINAYCEQRGLDEAIPAVSGRAWVLSTRQFRRTLAWFIARRPGGVIAGALQYRHHRVQMFEGYAGTSASGFRDEVESEEALARCDQLAALAADPPGRALTGPAAAEAESRLAAFAAAGPFAGMVITDPKRLARHLRQHDPHIYPGTFVTCVYNPDRALCTRGDDSTGPSLSDCVPLQCRNVAMAPDNRRALRGRLRELDAALSGGEALAPYIRHRLAGQRDELAAFLDRAGAEPA